ncbi:hypothetical protein FGG08_004149 [Glutinoglossum americanum]|uniref:Uncharacterized protein n=1 Tax=Glutinoglossum americanum TaxID=1670608 RepID=A0A9P8KZW2_9PEZI|nr:hypothetical protein FGG08_004149 [Glutinoglossum americanum]
MVSNTYCPTQTSTLELRSLDTPSMSSPLIRFVPMALCACFLYDFSLVILLTVLLATTPTATPTSAPAPTSTGSPLPFNGTYTCDFTTRAELIDRIMISLYVQAGLTFLFGPVLSTVQRFQTPTQRAIPSPLFVSLKRIQIVITDANAFLGITALIAALVRLQQRPAVFEMTFLKYLSSLMLLLIWTSVLSQITLNIGRTPRVLTISAYVSIAVSMLYNVFRDAGVPPAELSAYRGVVAECHASQGYQDLRIQQQAGLLSRKSMAKPVGGGLVVITVVGGILGACFSISARYSSKSPPASKGLRGSREWWLKYTKLSTWYTTLIVLTYLATAFLGIGLWQAQEARWLLRRAIGSSYQDDQWGFGQVTAALIPAPIFVTALHEIHGSLFKKQRQNPKQREDIVDLEGLEQEIPQAQEYMDNAE